MADMRVVEKTIVDREHYILASDAIRLLRLDVPRGSVIVRVQLVSLDDLAGAPGLLVVTQELPPPTSRQVPL